jgi:alkyldihydroxyacetonephosphate synthase
MDAMLWSGWGDPAMATAVPPPAVAARLASALGVQADRPRPAVSLDAVRLPEPTLPRTVLDELAGIVGQAYVRTGAEDRIRHTREKSTVDLLRIRAGDADNAPDAVVLPADHDQILAVFAVARPPGWRSSRSAAAPRPSVASPCAGPDSPCAGPDSPA